MKKIIAFGLGAALFTSASVVEAQTGADSSGAVRADDGGGTSASVDYYLKIDDIEGESEEKKGNVETKWKVEEGKKVSDDGDDSTGGDADSDENGTLKLQRANDEPKDRGVEREMKESGEKGGTEDINIGVGELQGNVVSINAVEVRGWDPKQKQEFLATVKAHAEVRSGEDLDNFARGVLVSDEEVEEVSIDEDRVEVRYRVPAFLLGFIESSLPVRAQVVFGDGEKGRIPAEVKVKFPWFGFLYGKVEAVTAAEIEADAQASLPEIDDEVVVGFEARASILQSLTAVLKARHDAAMASIRNIR